MTALIWYDFKLIAIKTKSPQIWKKKDITCIHSGRIVPIENIPDHSSHALINAQFTQMHLGTTFFTHMVSHDPYQ